MKKTKVPKVKPVKSNAKPKSIQQPELKLCWASPSDALMMGYHDAEWGKPLFDDTALFEFLILDAFQAGLSWRTVLYKRAAFRKAFDNFNAKKIAKYDEKKIETLCNNADIIRNKLKIRACITNAQAFLKIQKEFGSFSKYIWQFTNGKTIKNNWKTIAQIPAKTKQSDTMSKDLIKHGFKFVGSTICYAFMQATGMVNDHLVTCYCH